MIFIFLVLFFIPLFLSKPIRKLFAKPDIQFDDEYMFDDFVCNDFFVEEKYQVNDLIDKSGEIVTDDDILQIFRFTELSTGFTFFLKTKYIEKATESDFEWCTQKQFEFCKHNSQIPLFVIIGIEGPANFPNELFLIPLRFISSNKLTQNDLPNYKVAYNQTINMSVY